MAALGALILWFGWFGFNGGANLAMDLRIPLILINTFMAASAGLISSSIMGIIVLRKPEPMFMITGPIAGLVELPHLVLSFLQQMQLLLELWQEFYLEVF